MVICYRATVGKGLEICDNCLKEYPEECAGCGRVCKEKHVCSEECAKHNLFLEVTINVYN